MNLYTVYKEFNGEFTVQSVEAASLEKTYRLKERTLAFSCRKTIPKDQLKAYGAAETAAEAIQVAKDACKEEISRHQRAIQRAQSDLLKLGAL